MAKNTARSDAPDEPRAPVHVLHRAGPCHALCVRDAEDVQQRRHGEEERVVREVPSGADPAMPIGICQWEFVTLGRPRTKTRLRPKPNAARAGSGSPEGFAGVGA